MGHARGLVTYPESPHVRADDGDPLTPEEMRFRKAWRQPTSLERPSRYSLWAAEVRAAWAAARAVPA